MSPKKHIKASVFFLVSHEFRNLSTFKILYSTLVRSKLEYASVIWSPYSQKNNDILERIQKKYIRYLDYRITGIYPTYDHYTDLLNLYSMDSLASRRNHASLYFLYKIFNNIIDSSGFIHNFSINVPIPTTRPKHTFFKIPWSRTNALLNSPIVRMMRLYNEVSVNMDIFNQTQSEFLRGIQNH